VHLKWVLAYLVGVFSCGMLPKHITDQNGRFVSQHETQKLEINSKTFAHSLFPKSGKILNTNQIGLLKLWKFNGVAKIHGFGSNMLSIC